MTSPQTKEAASPWLKGKRVWLILGGLLVSLGGAGAYWLAGPRPSRDTGQEVQLGAENPPSTAPPWFRDMTAGSGIHFTYRNGEEADQFSILETLGGGVALLDYDGDGRLDIFVTGGGFFDGPDRKTLKGHPCKLYRNLGGMKFQDVTEEVGLGGAWFYTHGAAVADYDRDGWPDLLVTGYGRLALFHNESDGKGGRRFVNVTDSLGLRDDAWCTSAGWADLDGDGFPDLYVCHYVNWSFANNPICKGQIPSVGRDRCAPADFKPVAHALYRNEKGKSFRNTASVQGFRAAGNGLGVVLADLNGDGRPDIYVANDTNNNFLFINRGGKLEEKAVLAGVATDEFGRANGSMGVDVGDYDGSGRPSLWVTAFQNEIQALYRNLGRDVFDHQSRAAGVAALGLTRVAFGTGFLDVDNDGWEDLVITNGHVYRHPVGGMLLQRPVLLRNEEFRGRRFFKDASAAGGPFFQREAMGRGLAIGDLDNDGWPDMVVSHTNSPIVVLRNEAAATAPARWLGLRLLGEGHRDIVGTAVTLEGNTRRLTRFVKGGGGYLSASDSRLLFGLGASEEIRRLTVHWSWGKAQTWENLEPNDYWELREGVKAGKRVYEKSR